MTHRSIDRSIDQSINRSIDQSNDRTIDREPSRLLRRFPNIALLPFYNPVAHHTGLDCLAMPASLCDVFTSIPCIAVSRGRLASRVAWLGLAWRGARMHTFSRENERTRGRSKTNERTNETAQNNANDKCELHYCTVPKLNFQYTVKRPK